ILGWASPVLSRYNRQGPVGDKLYKIAETFEAARAEDVYLQLVSHWKEPASLVLNSQEMPTCLTSSEYVNNPPTLNSFRDWMMLMDTVSYLPDDILVKVDRAAMAASLESRVPFLDHRVVEFSWRVPSTLKVRRGRGKWILRELLDRYVPRRLIDRPKMGFGVPLARWLRGPL